MKNLEVLYFGSSWCVPCRLMKPIVNGLKTEGYKITYQDADETPDLLNKYSINSVPTFVILVDGEEVNRITGATTEAVFRNTLKECM